MLLEVRHTTQYNYAYAVRESVMEVWMQPQKHTRQRLVSFDIELDPPAQLFSYADSFGNPVYHFDVPQPHDRLTITARAAGPSCQLNRIRIRRHKDLLRSVITRIFFGRRPGDNEDLRLRPAAPFDKLLGRLSRTRSAAWARRSTVTR